MALARPMTSQQGMEAEGVSGSPGNSWPIALDTPSQMSWALSPGEAVGPPHRPFFNLGCTLSIVEMTRVLFLSQKLVAGHGQAWLIALGV